MLETNWFQRSFAPHDRRTTSIIFSSGNMFSSQAHPVLSAAMWRHCWFRRALMFGRSRDRQKGAAIVRSIGWRAISSVGIRLMRR